MLRSEMLAQWKVLGVLDICWIVCGLGIFLLKCQVLSYLTVPMVLYEETENAVSFPFLLRMKNNDCMKVLHKTWYSGTDGLCYSSIKEETGNLTFMYPVLNCQYVSCSLYNKLPPMIWLCQFVKTLPGSLVSLINFCHLLWTLNKVEN